MKKQKVTSKKVYAKSFESQQPLSTFDLDDEIVPKVLMTSNNNSDVNTRKGHINNAYNTYATHQTPLQFFTIYEKGDEEKTFHNEEIEKRSDNSNNISRNELCYTEYPTPTLRSGTNNTEDENILNPDNITPEYYEQLLFIQGESPRASTEIKDRDVDTKAGNLSDDYEDVQVEEARYENQSVINAVEKAANGNLINDYENIEYVRGRLIPKNSKRYDSEGMYAIGRRFPSFRIINGKKKKLERMKNDKKCNKSGKQLSNPSVNTKEATDAIYSRPKKWKFKCKRALKDNTITKENDSEASENSTTKSDKLSRGECYDIIDSKEDIAKDLALETKMSVLYSDKLKKDTIASEPGYSNINCAMSLQQNKHFPENTQRRGCDSSRNKFMDCIKICSGCSSSFFKSTNKNCCCWYCGTYNISKENTQASNADVIKDVEKGEKSERNPRCATKSICCLVSVLFLTFVAAGAILLYQSLSGKLVFSQETDYLVNDSVVEELHYNTGSDAIFHQSYARIPLSTTLKSRHNVITTNDERGENRRIHKNTKNNWSPWSLWSPCSDECMSGESQGRSRQCLDETGTSMEDVLPCVENGEGSNVEIRLCPCNEANRRQNLRNKRTEKDTKRNSQLLPNYIPDIVPFMLENKRNNSTNHVMPNKTTDNVMPENRKISETVGKYYYKVL